MMEAIRSVLEREPRIAYALVFGSAAREDGRPVRDLAVAIGLLRRTRLSVTDRTAREVVALNLFVALQEAVALASHWLADAGWDVPTAYRDLFSSLAAHGVLSQDLARRLSAATGLRNLLAHQYGVLDWKRI